MRRACFNKKSKNVWLIQILSAINQDGESTLKAEAFFLDVKSAHKNITLSALKLKMISTSGTSHPLDVVWLAILWELAKELAPVSQMWQARLEVGRPQQDIFFGVATNADLQRLWSRVTRICIQNFPTSSLMAAQVLLLPCNSISLLRKSIAFLQHVKKNIEGRENFCIETVAENCLQTLESNGITRGLPSLVRMKREWTEKVGVSKEAYSNGLCGCSNRNEAQWFRTSDFSAFGKLEG